LIAVSSFVEFMENITNEYLFMNKGWDTVQAFASSISGSLATSAVLKVSLPVVFLEV
jgi:hypothetical protein